MRTLLFAIVIIFASSRLKADAYVDGISLVGLGNQLSFSSIFLSNDDVLIEGVQITAVVSYQGTVVQTGTLSNISIPNGTSTVSLSGMAFSFPNSGTRSRMMRDFNWVVPGEYSVCIQLKHNGNALDESCESHEESNDVIIENITPEESINLNDIQGSLISFCWSSNLPSDDVIQYTLSIYPVHANQTTADAVLNNTSIYSQSTVATCLNIPSSILITSGYTNFAWNVKVDISDVVNGESGTTSNTISIGESYPSALELSNEVLLEYCYITPEANSGSATVYPVQDCELLLDLEEFQYHLPDSIFIEFSDSSSFVVGHQIFQLVHKKRFIKVPVDLNTCALKNQEFRVKLNVAGVIRFFNIVFY